MCKWLGRRGCGLMFGMRVGAVEDQCSSEKEHHRHNGEYSGSVVSQCPRVAGASIKWIEFFLGHARPETFH